MDRAGLPLQMEGAPLVPWRVSWGEMPFIHDCLPGGGLSCDMVLREDKAAARDGRQSCRWHNRWLVGGARLERAKQQQRTAADRVARA